MKMLALLASLILGTSCAEYSGATYAANGITGEYRAKTFLTDLTGAKITPKGTIIAGQNQSKVALSAIRTAGTVATAIGMANALTDQTGILSNNSTAEVLGAQKAGVATEQIKSNTALGLGAQAVERTAILNPVKP